MKQGGVIIIHPSGTGTGVAFDIFGDNSDFGYKVEDCQYVQSFVSMNRRTDYSWSEDLRHVDEINESVKAKINELIKNGFKLYLLGWDLDY